MESTEQNTEQQTQATTQYISKYCERKDQAELLSEPLNLITNLAFIVAAVMAFKMLKFYKQITLKNFDIVLLTIILGTIGIGSGLFHSSPSALTQTLDVIPIQSFIFMYLGCFFVRVIGLKPVYMIMVLVAFLWATIMFGKNVSPDMLNGTIMYVPTYAMLIIMIFLMGFVKQSPLYLHLINTTVIWTFSLAFRTIDLPMCSYTHSIGTHFMWHILNAIVIYRMLVLVVMDKLAKQNVSSN